MKKIRIIPRLDIKGPNVVKGIRLEGIRVVGKPAVLAKKYFEQGADEILYMDVVASLYERENLLNIVRKTTSLGVYIPITVGGGIRTLGDIKQTLRAGADKVTINTAATKDPDFISKAKKKFGSQCIIGSIEAKKISENKWEAYIDSGRQKTGLDAIEWAKTLVELGVGELLITSVDKEGMQKGYDIDLLNKIVPYVSVPVIVSGGAGNKEHIKNCIEDVQCDAISMASILHYNKITINEIKQYLINENINVRSSFHLNNKKSVPSSLKKCVSIIDYGLGNLQSVYNGFQYVKNPVKFIKKPEDVYKAELLVLPGVGAFEDGINGLNERNLIEPIKEYIESGKPFLGICLGMQLLMSKGYEFGIHDGLNIIKGKVVRFKDSLEVDDNGYKVPLIGWNSIYNLEYKKWNKTILNDIPNNSETYFVHSYFVIPEDINQILAKAEYYNQEFCSVIRKNNVFGCQFHPEMSGDIGLRILDNFGRLNEM